MVTNAPKFQSNSLNVILFDAANGDFSEHVYARDQLLKFLNGAALERPVAIFALQTQLKLLHDFSTDNKSLSVAVAKYRPPARQSTARPSNRELPPFPPEGTITPASATLRTR